MECDKPKLRAIISNLTAIDGRPVTVVQRLLTYSEDAAGKDICGFKQGHWDGLKLRAWLQENNKAAITDLSESEVAVLYSSDCYVKGDDLYTPAGRRMFLYYVACSMGMKSNKGMGEGWSLGEVTVDAICDTFTEADVMRLIVNVSKLKEMEAEEVKN